MANVSNNLLAHCIDNLPELPSTRTDYYDVLPIVEQRLSDLLPILDRLKKLHDLEEMSDAEYTLLRDKLRLYRHALHQRIAPIRRCPPEILARIIRDVYPEVRIDDFPPFKGKGIPRVHCPQLTRIAVVSPQFHAAVHGNRSLFTTVRFRRHYQCTTHYPNTAKAIQGLIQITDDVPLHLTVEYLGSLHPEPLPPQTLSTCASMSLFTTKPWKSFTIWAESSVAALVLQDRTMAIKLTSQFMTTIRISITRSLTNLLGAIAAFHIPLDTLTIEATHDSWQEPNMNHTHLLPATVRHVNVTGSSRTVLTVFRSAVQVPSINVALKNGRRADSSTYNAPGNYATTNATLKLPIVMTSLTVLDVITRDYTNSNLADLFRWIRAPSLAELRIEWADGINYVDSICVFRLNTFIEETALRRLFLFRLPARFRYATPPKIRAPPGCIVEQTCVGPAEDEEESDPAEYSCDQWDTWSRTTCENDCEVECTCRLPIPAPSTPPEPTGFVVWVGE
ncbi:hypothetical protein VNI00_001720 [Paramarasmius palmivorus]|uniref:F-box domain-containing protein n=1 Tax=Paramarasmius palmivorus TaxID=297713 RepID=A0AAW0E1R8_9AGAR